MHYSLKWIIYEFWCQTKFRANRFDRPSFYSSDVYFFHIRDESSKNRLEVFNLWDLIVKGKLGVVLKFCFFFCQVRVQILQYLHICQVRDSGFIDQVGVEAVVYRPVGKSGLQPRVSHFVGSQIKPIRSAREGKVDNS